MNVISLLAAAGGEADVTARRGAVAVFMVVATAVVAPPLLLWSLRRDAPQAAAS